MRFNVHVTRKMSRTGSPAAFAVNSNEINKRYHFVERRFVPAAQGKPAIVHVRRRAAMLTSETR